MNDNRHALRCGKIIDEKDAVVPVTLKEVQSSFSVYEALRVLEGKVVHLSDHIKRMEKSAETIGLILPSVKWEEAINLLVASDNIKDATMRILVIGAPEPLWFITWTNLLTYPDSYYDDGVSVVLYEGERFLPQCKTGNLLLNYLSQKKAKENSAFEALLVNREERILEGSRSNFYIIKGKTLKTAPDEEVLDGITRMSVIKAAKMLGYTLDFTAPKVEEIWSADACFISSTSMGAMSIKEIDGRKVNCDINRVKEICSLVRKWELD